MFVVRHLLSRGASRRTMHYYGRYYRTALYPLLRARQHLPEALGWEEAQTAADSQAVQAVVDRDTQKRPGLFARWHWVRSP
jgi:hypothetical protein